MRSRQKKGRGSEKTKTAATTRAHTQASLLMRRKRFVRATARRPIISLSKGSIRKKGGVGGQWGARHACVRAGSPGRIPRRQP